MPGANTWHWGGHGGVAWEDLAEGDLARAGRLLRMNGYRLMCHQKSRHQRNHPTSHCRFDCQRLHHQFGWTLMPSPLLGDTT